jgi:hypothetical protein
MSVSAAPTTVPERAGCCRTDGERLNRSPTIVLLRDQFIQATIELLVWTTDESQGVGVLGFRSVIGRGGVAETVRASPVALVWDGLAFRRAFCAVFAQSYSSPGVAATGVRR